MSDPKSRIDEFLKNKQQQYDQSKLGRLQQDVTLVQKFLWTFANALTWLYGKSFGRVRLLTMLIVSAYVAFVLKYIHSIPLPLLIVSALLFIIFDKWIFWSYIKVWNWYTYRADKYGARVFHKVRGGAMVLGTALALFLLMPFVSELAWDAGWFAATNSRHVYYSNDATPVSGFQTFQTKGCENHIGCSDQETVAYRIHWTPFNQLYSLINHRSQFLPDFVAGAIPQVPAKCEVLTYGLRVKFFARNFDWFPDLLEAQCMPLMEKK